MTYTFEHVNGFRSYLCVYTYFVCTFYNTYVHIHNIHTIYDTVNDDDDGDDTKKNWKLSVIFLYVL